MSKYSLEFPGEPIVWVKDSSALEFPGEPRAHTKGVKYDLVSPEGEEAREAAKDTEVQEVTKDTEVQEKPAEDKAAQGPYVLTLAHSETETTEEPLEACEERKAPHLYPYASPCPARVFARPLAAVAALALAGVAAAAARPSAGRLRPVLAVSALAVASVVARAVRGSRGRR